MKKIAFFDLDGTLLNEEKKVLFESKESIKRARDNGIEVVICSGRPQSQVRCFQKEAGAGRYIISANGAEIFDTLEEEQLYYCSLDKSFCKEIINYINENDLFFRIDTRYGRYINQEHNRIMNEILFDEDIDKFIEDNNILQISIGSTDSSKIDNTITYLKRFNNIKCENRFLSKATRDRLDIINILNVNASKGNAIIGLCKYLKIELKDSVAFGDDNNDISMMKAVGYPIAMGNATDEIKSLAKEITLKNNEPGISKVLNRLIEDNKRL